MRALILIAALGLSASVVQQTPNPQAWPQVEPVRQVFRVSDPEHAVIKATVHSANGEALYLFICRTPDDPEAMRLHIIYAGDLDCRLMEASAGEVETNLLVEAEGVAAWYSRGRVFADELFGECAAYPEYGRKRTFLLRGMRVVLEFTDVRFGDDSARSPQKAPQLRGYVLTFQVERDPSATGSIAASSGYLDPSRIVHGRPRGCSAVREGREWE